MNDEQKLQNTGLADKVKLGAAIVLVVAGVAAFYVLPSTEPLWMRWLAVAVGVALAAAVIVPSSYGRAMHQFWLDSRVELRKVVWPTRRETGLTTAVVFGFVVIAGVFFWVVDLVLAWATRHLTGQGG
jgi:preprotein translocase subunit SecE